MSKKEFLKKLLIRKEDLLENFDFQKNVLNELISIGFIYVNNHFNETENKFSNMMMQMSLLKGKSILKLAEGEVFEGVASPEIPIIDIQSISSIYRSLFENYCFFNHLYIRNWTDEEFLVIENLWRISSLKQRISLLDKSVLLKEKTVFDKINNEKEEIIRLIKEIEKTNIYNKNKKNINNFIKTQKWQLTIENGKVKYISWKEMFNNKGKDSLGSSKKDYQRFSLDTHPTYFSVFQFGELYKNREDLNRRSTVVFETIKLLCYYLNDFENLIKIIPEINIESKYLIEILGKNSSIK
ncbi:hypothetical protein [uncultured Olleya sp.]|uniref:hypothetical protein n=1 Tax=uncultured Olleya sp. TaxID=757243 RepID=UPI002599D239|nr:hypothetical protein [uncultured Olleya sp.]